MKDDRLGIADAIWTAEKMMCPKDEPHTGDDNRTDHGHTLCWVLGELLNEIERLRAAGDALANQITRPCRCVEAHDGAINETCAPCAAYFEWEEARRG